jgi:hypothetical protein
MVQGVHLMPLGWADIVPKILQTAQIAIWRNFFEVFMIFPYRKYD